MSLPTVSVVIPCYNRARYVREAIESALAQSVPPLEVIAVDDGSTDETPSVLVSYGSRITFLRQPNGGVAQARNTGIAAAQGDYVGLLDSDDAWLPEKLAEQMKLAVRWPDAVLLHTLCETMDEESRTRPGVIHGYPDRREEDALERLMGHCYPTTSTCVILRKALTEVGGFDVDFERGGGFAAEDWELYLRLAEVGPFASVGACLARYRVHHESKTLADRLPHTLGLIHLRRKIEARKAYWLARRDTPELHRALARHTHEFAHVWGRLGLIYQQRGEPCPARDAFGEAMRLEPRRLKHHLRYLRMLAAASVRVRGTKGEAR